MVFPEPFHSLVSTEKATTRLFRAHSRGQHDTPVTRSALEAASHFTRGESEWAPERGQKQRWKGRRTPGGDGPRPPRSPVRSFAVRGRPGSTRARGAAPLRTEETVWPRGAGSGAGAGPVLETGRREARAYQKAEAAGTWCRRRWEGAGAGGIEVKRRVYDPRQRTASM